MALRLSLLAALGVVPAACGGMHTSEGDVAGTAGSGGGTAAVTPETCTNPQLDPITQLVSCAEGYRHRPRAMACAPQGSSNASQQSGASDAAPAPDAVGPVPLPRARYETCTDDSSICSAFQYGYCQQAPGPGQRSVCHSGCVVDADCGEGYLCMCGSWHLQQAERASAATVAAMWIVSLVTVAQAIGEDAREMVLRARLRTTPVPTRTAPATRAANQSALLMATASAAGYPSAAAHSW